MNDNNKIAIIGAGIAGMSAGIYAQMNGYQSIIFEKHNLPGGLCTSWKRKDYTFDGCIQWLTGSAPGTSLFGMWQELGAVQGRMMVNHDELFRIEGADGKNLILYTNMDRLERHLKELAPEDSRLISHFIRAVRAIANFNPPLPKAPELRNVWDQLRAQISMLSLMPSLKDYSKLSISDFAQKFKNPFLRQAFPLMFFDMGDFPVTALLGTLAFMHTHRSGYPIGGSLQLARAIEKRYRDLGGQIYYKSPVKNVLIEDHRAVGLELEDGSVHHVNRVISTADGRWTIFDLLKGTYLNETITDYYKNLPLYPPVVLVSFGINRDLSQEPHAVYCHLDNPLDIASKNEYWLGIRHYGFDPTLTKPGKSIVSVEILTEYAYWKELSRNRAQYDEEKKRIADRIIAILEHRFPGISDQIEVVDVATPVTFERYTGTWQGSFMGWKTAAGVPRIQKTKTLPGLSNFYMAGMWVEPTGGLPSAAKSGRDVIQIICHEDKKKFFTSIC